MKVVLLPDSELRRRLALIRKERKWENGSPSGKYTRRGKYKKRQT